jgi:hypothetical protein
LFPVLTETSKIYLRDYELKLRQSPHEAVDQARNLFVQSLYTGQKLLLAVDDMPSQERTREWKELYDPDITNLVSTTPSG